MASCITEQFGNGYCPQVRLTVTQTASTNTNATLTWVLEYVAYGYAFGLGSRTYSVEINGQTITGAFTASGVTSTKTITQGSIVVDRGTSASTVSFSVFFPFRGYWNGVYAASKSASGTISVAARPSYTIAFSGNGGSGAPSSQRKWYGVDLVLPSTKPSRTGYTFLGWATSSAGSAAYAAGAKYTANANATLYAAWKAYTYTVSFNANGGSGAPGNQTKTYGTTLVLSSTKPKRTNYNFLGWGTSASATSATYSAGGNYTANAAITLYAVWKLAYVAPRITNLTADRCNSSGTLAEDGTYAVVKFNWACDKSNPTITIVCNGATTTITGSGTSGSVSKVIGGSLSTENLYPITITVKDSAGSSSISKDLPAMKYIIDFKTGGKGVAFGKPAQSDGLDIAMNTTFRKGYSITMELSNGRQAKPLSAIHANNYYGVVLPDGSDTNWFRTTKSGIIPYVHGGSSSIGTSSWPFNTGHFKQVLVSGRNICANKVLWSGAWYMHSGQTVVLSEAITAQPNGIVLVFSPYNVSTDSPEDWHFQSFYVPKYLVQQHSAKGHFFNMISTTDYKAAVSKYLDISDTIIGGRDSNTSSGTGASGLTYNNNARVLRYVIGV